MTYNVFSGTLSPTQSILVWRYRNLSLAKQRHLVTTTVTMWALLQGWASVECRLDDYGRVTVWRSCVPRDVVRHRPRDYVYSSLICVLRQPCPAPYVGSSDVQCPSDVFHSVCHRPNTRRLYIGHIVFRRPHNVFLSKTACYRQTVFKLYTVSQLKWRRNSNPFKYTVIQQQHTSL